jgi:hypothetical protein
MQTLRFYELCFINLSTAECLLRLSRVELFKILKHDLIVDRDLIM